MPTPRNPRSSRTGRQTRTRQAGTDGRQGAFVAAIGARAQRASVAVGPGQWDGASPFPPIAEYAFLSDCHTGALVAPDGSVEWLCLARFDEPSVFGALLDRSAGNFRLAPYGVDVPAGRRYVPGTNVLETTWMTPTGWVVVRDALTIGDWQHAAEPTEIHTRPPTDHDADYLLVRTVECVQGEVPIELICAPRFDYGRKAASWSPSPEEPELVLDATDGKTTIRLMSDMRMGIEGSDAHARHTLREGERRYCSLNWGSPLGGPWTYEEAGRTHHPHRPLLARVSMAAGELPGPPLARLPSSAPRSSSRPSPTRRRAR